MSAVGQLANLSNIRCPSCGNKVLHKSSDGQNAALRPAGLVRFTHAGCEMSCNFCKKALALPLRLIKSEGRATERLLLKK